MTTDVGGAGAVGRGDDDTGAPTPNTPSRFRRIQRGRWHSYELDGQRIPGVTQLIRDGIPKPNLIDWAARAAAEYAADNIDEIARLERDAAVDLIKIRPPPHHRDCAGEGHRHPRLAQRLADGEHRRRPRRHRRLRRRLPRASSTTGNPSHRHSKPPSSTAAGGTPAPSTCSPASPGIGPVVVDVKTGGSGVWPETCLQIAAYRAAEHCSTPTAASSPCRHRRRLRPVARRRRHLRTAPRRVRPRHLRRVPPRRPRRRLHGPQEGRPDRPAARRPRR